MTNARLAALLTTAAAVATLALPGRKAHGPHGDGRGDGRGESAPVRASAARVGLVFDVGGRGDKSFNDASFAGLERAERELGVAAEVLEPASSEDREAAMRLFAARGFDLVVGVGFIFSSDIGRVAQDFPRVKFACVDYAPPPGPAPPNLAGLAFREEQGSFLVGAVAGQMTRTRQVGFVGGMQTPLVRKFEAGYRAGVAAVCPDCAVHAAYAGTTPDAFKDPATGKAIAIAEIAEGADVLYHAAGATGHGVLEAAHDAGCMAIGVDADQYDEMPDTVVTSMIKRADVAVFDAIRTTAAGRFDGGMHVFGVADGAVDYVHTGPHAARLPPAVIAEVERLRGLIAAGALAVPQAP